MQCTRVSEQLPERRNQTVSKAVRRRAGTPGRAAAGGGGRCPERSRDAGGRGSVGGTRAAGYVGALAAPGPSGVRRRGGGPGWAGVSRVGVGDTRAVGDARHSRPLGGLGCREGREAREGGPGGAGREQLCLPPGSGRGPAEPCGT